MTGPTRPATGGGTPTRGGSRSDARLRATYEAVAPGLAQYVHDAIVANAEAHGA